jgi:flavin reductase (DIM6/NTAB) family NADH-FMN oxidoreductase RutF
MDIDGRELRNALGRFATGVCLITTVSEEGEALALTANSFSSVSLDPPLVLWCLQNNSDVYDIFARPRYFAINVLAKEQQDHSNRYARKGDHQIIVGRVCDLQTRPTGEPLLFSAGAYRELR